MKKFREYNTNIYVEEQGTSKISLLQSPNKVALSKFFSNDGEVRAITNCSYFTSSYVLGRNQGDMYNEAPDQDFYSVVIRKDGTYGCGKYMSWDERDNIVAGFSPAVVLIKDGKDVELISNAISGAKSRLTSKNPNTAFGIKKDGKAILIVNDGRVSSSTGMTGRELRTAIKKYYNLDLLVLLDGGGSTELIIDKKIVNVLSDGSQRPMFNGLAFIGGKGAQEQDMADIIKPVKRDESKDQLEVIASNLRVRETPTTSGKVVGHAELNGIYNNLEQKKTTQYTWYRIGTNQWIADNGEWLKLLPKKEDDKDKKIKQLTEEISTLTEKINTLNKEITSLKNNTKTLESKISKALDCLG